MRYILKKICQVFICSMDSVRKSNIEQENNYTITLSTSKTKVCY